MKNQQKGFALIVIVIVAVAVLALGTGAVFYYQKQKATPKESLATILGNLSYDFPNQGQTKLTNGLFSKKVEVCGNQSCNGIY